MKTTNSWIKLWGQPLLIGLLSITGLIVALIGDGIFDMIAWICLLYPLIRMSYHYGKKTNASVSKGATATGAIAPNEELAYADKTDLQ